MIFWQEYNGYPSAESFLLVSFLISYSQMMRKCTAHHYITHTSDLRIQNTA